MGEHYVGGKQTPRKPQLAPASALPALESRTCICGCGRMFRVTAASPLVYASRKCEAMVEQRAKDAKLVSKVLKRPLIELPKDQDSEDDL